MRGMGCVGLVLIDKGGRLVDVFMNIVSGTQDIIRTTQIGCPTQGHKSILWLYFVAITCNTIGTMGNQRIIRFQWHKYRSTAALVYEIQAVVKELPKKCKPCVVRC